MYNKRPLCPTQPNLVLRKHFLSLEGRRLWFRQGSQPGGTGAHDHTPCILFTPTAVRSSPTSRGLWGDVWPPGFAQCYESPGGLDLLLLQLMHPRQQDGQQRREERSQTRHHTVKTRAHVYIKDHKYSG